MIPVLRVPPRWMALLAVLAGCPQERPGAEKQIPSQRLPPAVSVEPALASPDGGGTPGHAPAPARRP